MAKILYQTQINGLARELSRYGRVVAPMVRHAHSGASKVVFDDYRSGEPIDLDYPVSVLPPKEVFLPAEETLFEFEDGKAEIPKYEDVVIFGSSLEDLEGIQRLKKIFAGPISDEPFLARARKVIVIAADKYSPPKNMAFDVYLQKIGADRYAAFAGSVSGQKILKLPHFKTEKVSVPRVTKTPDHVLSDPNLSAALKRSRGSKIWDDLARECFACGVCSYVCPLCYCFETEDRTELGGKEGKGRRVRRWSSCFSEDFAQTSAHNFRAERSDRIYNWYHHKFVQMPAEHGFSGCVECNRCFIFCPARINYRDVLVRVLAEYGKGKKK